jgi:hypothetical protein
MDSNVTDEVIVKLRGNQKQTQRTAAWALVSILFVVIFLFAASFWLATRMIASPGGEMGESLQFFFVFVGIIAVTFMLYAVSVFSSLLKYSLMMSNFWSSRELALTLYQSQEGVSLRDLVSALTPENIRFSLGRQPIADLLPKVSFSAGPKKEE